MMVLSKDAMMSKSLKEYEISSALTGSSRSKICASWHRARAMSPSCFCPPERRLKSVCAKCARFNASRFSSALSLSCLV